jgi:formate dehydrogenase iron-sulfur subunit
MQVSRRDFLKLFGASAAMLGMGAEIAPPSLANSAHRVPISNKIENGVLIDTTQCVGCRSCERACEQANNLPIECPAPGLTATTLTFVDMRNTSPNSNQPVIKPVKRQCMHCVDPACVASCPVGALYKRDNGSVAYDADKCIGCRYCMMACPFGIPRYDWNSPNPKINKCAQNCMANGQRDRPACVEACPAQALTYGKRSDLIAFAKDRIAQNPGRYVDYIYGENELGGTTMLYLSGTPFQQLGFRTDLPNEPLPNLTWNAQSKIPFVLGGVGVLLSSIAWWTHRGESKKLAEAPVSVKDE